MKITLNSQDILSEYKNGLRGLGVMALKVIEMLIQSNKNNYEILFYDYKKERNNRDKILHYIDNFGVPIVECNELDVRTFQKNHNLFESQSFKEYTKTNSDIYYYPSLRYVPANTKCKNIVVIHDCMWLEAPYLHFGKANEFWNDFLHIVENDENTFIQTISEYSKSEILKHSKIPEEKIQVIFLGGDNSDLYIDKSKNDILNIVDGDYILFLGAIEHKKNVFRLIEAFNIVADKNKDIKLVLAGSRSSNYCDSYIDEALYYSGSKDRIIFTHDVVGYFDNGTKRKLYSNALCFVFPSLHEGWGLPVTEAMQCGCPVICSDRCSLPEIAGDAAVYVNALNTNQLAYEMERVINSESLRKEMIQKGFDNVKRFSWNDTTKQIEQLFERVYRL